VDDPGNMTLRRFENDGRKIIKEDYDPVTKIL
jgi:hypothetical protein